MVYPQSRTREDMRDLNITLSQTESHQASSFEDAIRGLHKRLYRRCLNVRAAEIHKWIDRWENRGK